MAPRLIIHFDGVLAAWLDDSGVLVRGALAKAAAQTREREVTILVPGEQILLTTVRLPPVRQAGRRLQAARYALEDHLADRVENLHFALGPRADALGATPAAVIDLARMHEYSDAFEAAGLDVVQLCPDALALPPPSDDAWQVAILGKRALVRTGTRSGFACEVELWPLLLQAAETPPHSLTVHTADKEKVMAILAAPATEDASDVAPEMLWETYPDDDAVLAAVLHQTANTASPMNLRQGAFARASALQAWWQPLRITAGLAAAGLVLAVTARGIEDWQLHKRIETLHATSLQAFHTAFPDEKQINDLRVQAEERIRALRGNGGNSGVFPLLQAVAEVTGAADNLSVQSLQYRGGKLYLSLHGKNVQAVEALRAGFAHQRGTTLTVDSADAAADGVQIQASVSRSHSS